MKNLGLTLLALTIAFGVFAQNKEIRNLASFDELSVGQAIEVIMEEGSSEKVIVEVSGTDLEDVITEVKGGKLDIRMARGNYNNVDVTVYVTYKSLRGIDVSSAATLESKTVIKAPNFEIDINSAGKATLELDVDELDANVNSAGKLKLSGNSNYCKINVGSAGKMNAYDLISKKVNANVNSGGKAEVNVTGQLDADANSGGVLSYKGNPDKVYSDSNSGGRIKKY